MVTPTPSEPVGTVHTAASHTQEIVEGLEVHPLAPHGPMSPAMFARAEVTFGKFKELVKILPLEDANHPSSRGGPPDHDADDVLPIASSKRAKTASSRTARKPDDGDTSFSTIRGTALSSFASRCTSQ